ncbi:MAG: lipid-A-disaccharide synthase [Elusimicrobia bacterium]|nr:lipid-A-disaccharide synthase [Elusimicrobiota bacterium]
MSRILISTGDYSADLHGQFLIQELQKCDPALFVMALGGIKLKSVSNLFLKDLVELDVSGFSQPLKQFFNLKNILQKIVFPQIDKNKIDAVILIDYYGFNIHVAEKATKENIPVFYFVSPQVWASRKWRIQKLKKNVTKMLVIFPFEEELYKKNNVPVEFVGHPLIELLPQNLETLKTDGKIRLGLLPGSREREIVRHIPLLIEAYKKLKSKIPQIEGTLFEVDSIPNQIYETLIQKAGKEGLQDLKRVRETDYKIRSSLTLALTASGTATLENALLGIPMVVLYQTSILTYWIAKKIIQVPFISMPNILMKKMVVPELIQNCANPEAIVQAAENLLANPKILAATRKELIQLRLSLGPPGAYKRAAQIIYKATS